MTIIGETPKMHNARFHPLVNPKVIPEINIDELKNSIPNFSPNAF